MVRKIRLAACEECDELVVVDASGDVREPIEDECRHCGADIDEESIV